MTLYEFTKKGKELYELLTAELPEDEEQQEILERIIADTMESIGIEEKLESYAAVINQLSADVDMLKREETRLANRRKTIESNIARMKGAVMGYMDAIGSTKEKAGTFTISFRKSNIVDIENTELIPDEYIKIVTEPKLDKVAMKNAMKDGITIPGASLVESRSVQIK